LEGELEFALGPPGLGGFIFSASCLLKFLLQLVNESVVFGKFMLRPSEFGLHHRQLGPLLAECVLELLP
jgi:hypothetical protein